MMTTQFKHPTNDDSFPSFSSCNDDDSDSHHSRSPLKHFNSTRIPEKKISDEKPKLLEKIYPITKVFSRTFLEARKIECVKS